MKAIQFQKTDCRLSGHNDQEIMNILGGTFEFEGCGTGRITTFKADNGQEKPIQLDDWILEFDGALVVLSNEEYQLLQSEQKLIEIKAKIDFEVKSFNQQKSKLWDELIGNTIRNIIKKEKRQGGLLR